MPNILIFGTGGVGAIYAFILQRGGANITAVCRSNFQIAQANGFTIVSQIWGRHTFHPSRIVSSVSDAAGPFDYIVVCSKAPAGLSPSTAELIRPAVGPTTTIVLCQNGIEIEAEYAAAFPRNTIVSGVVYLPVTQTRPGHIVHGELENLEIGTFPSTASAEAKAHAEAFAQVFTAGGGSIKVHDDVQERRWTKLITNAAWNPICALSQCSDAAFLRTSEQALGIVRRAMLEVVSVARAKGYDMITAETAEWHLARAIGRLDKPGLWKEPSMLTDVREERHRSMEVEPICGNTVRAAKELGVETPTLDTIYVLIKGLSMREMGPK